MLNKLFSEYGGSPGKSPTGKVVASLVSPGDDTRSVDATTATKAWNWREDASEWELKSLTSALGLPSAGTRPELVEVVQKHLTDLAEPADQLSVSLAKLARIITAHDKSPILKLGKGDSVVRVRDAVLELHERAKEQVKLVLEADPFKEMQNREQGPCVLDLAYLYMDFVSRAFGTMMPLLRAESVGALEAGTSVTQQLNRCMFLIFKVIGTSTNEGNLYDPRRAGKFLIELGRLRRAWRLNCGTILSLNSHFDEIVNSVDSVVASESSADVEPYDPTQIIQLTPYALTELHESYHGPPTHAPSTARTQEPSDVPKSWSAVWQPVSGASSPGRQNVRDASTSPEDNIGIRDSGERIPRASNDGRDAPRVSSGNEDGAVEHAIPLNRALMGLHDQRERRRDAPSSAAAHRSTSANFAQRAWRFEMPQRRVANDEHELLIPRPGGHVVDLSDLHGPNQGEPDLTGMINNNLTVSDRAFMDWVNQGHMDTMVDDIATGRRAAREAGEAENDDAQAPPTDANEARLHASRLASSTQVHARLTFTERGQPVRVPTQQPLSQARMREATGITRLVSNLSTRLRSVSAPLLDTGKNKTRSPNMIKLFEHIARWELLGYSNTSDVAKIGTGSPHLLCERLAKQSAKDGRWCAVLGRALTVHCMPMQICIMNGLLSETNGEFPTTIAPASMFCTAVTVVIRMVLAAYVEAGEAPKLRPANWWKTLAHLADVLICWSSGSNGISLTFPNTGNSGRHEMSDVVAKAILAGLVMEDGLGPDCCSPNAELSWGKLFAQAAPKLLHDLADAEVSTTVVDSVSGLCFLFARIICDAAKTDTRWVPAIELTQTTIPQQLRQSVLETAMWAKEVRLTAERAGSVSADYMNKADLTVNDDPSVPGLAFHDKVNARRGVRLGVLVGLAAAISSVSGMRIKSCCSRVTVPLDDDGAALETGVETNSKAAAKSLKLGPSSASNSRRASRSQANDVVDLDPVVAALNDCVSALACIATPLAILGWALDGGHKGIRGGLSLLGNSRWLTDSQGEFPVYSPAQQIVDMTQLLLHCFCELRPPNASASNTVNALLTDPKWHKTFSMLQAASPNMFYFGSSLDLIGASADVFPHSFKISRLRKDLKRHAAEFQNASSISLVLDRSSPCPSAWRAINSLCRRALVGRSLNASFEGEDGLGDGVNREAMQILIDTLARGAPNKPGEAVLCALSSENANASAFLTLRPDAPLAAAVFFGKVIGLIISSNVTVVLPLAPWLWSALLGRRGTLSQLSAVDEEFGRTLMTLHTHPLSHEKNKWVEMSGLNFSRTVRLPSGEMAEYELVSGGRQIAVTDHNRKHFVQSYAWNSMEMVHGESIEVVAQAARKGLCDVIPAELLSSLSPVDLERLVCGLPKISVEAWKKATIYEPKVTTPEEERRVEWFWEAITQFSSADQALLLHFWAAYTHLPHSGFEGLNFKVRFDEKLSTDHLPMAQTCFLTLKLPKYASAEQTAARLLHAVRTGSSGFGFA